MFFCEPTWKSNQPHQVQAAPKKAPKKKEEQTEKVEPKTVREIAAEKMPEMLKDAGAARQQSIKLNGVAYAGDLAKELLGLAQEIEGLYQPIQKALKGKDDNVISSLLEKLKSKEEANEKAKAGRLGYPPVVFTSISWWILFVFPKFTRNKHSWSEIQNLSNHLLRP